MDLETKIDSRLWQAVKSSYESSNFSNAILDGVYFLGELIRVLAPVKKPAKMAGLKPSRYWLRA
jgi:hypothetical protein